MAEIVDPAAAFAAGEPEPEPLSTAAAAAAAAEDDEDDEEEGDVCRICRNRGDDEHPLRYPCACSGSIKFVHQDCLLQWLDHSNSRQCEVTPLLPVAGADAAACLGSLACRASIGRRNRSIGC
jgi:E3 ubiquitin-protein ligase MARCH6